MSAVADRPRVARGAANVRKGTALAGLAGMAMLASLSACAASMATTSMDTNGCTRLPAGTTAIVLTPSAITLSAGGRLTLSAASQAGSPVSACMVRWNSSDSSAVHVDQSGQVEARRAGGSAEITASAPLGTVRGVAVIRVAPAGP